ncbi:outer membrane beta-barrel protein [Pararcticibacter amylolyticus]|uniref:Outer membrane protein beta-barrel domain-containing protein n=1 Tax=Pararcticibacter amylolyticus TaxID=2173175 RepID=A0A2U2PGY0_9SPHI|nr:outer membrane beta-barrel protein [Pararcticibacter amylolyticus]PWG80512.1 hypothetical protein DDR33_10770 [Pararcticibacter amylolyticus]
MKPFWLYLIFLLPASVFAQNEFRRFAVGANAGITTSKNDLSSSKYKFAFGGTADFYFSRYVNIGAELQKGKLAGSESASPGRYFVNDYKAATAYGKVHLGQFMGNSGRYHFNDEGIINRFIKGIYAGSGIGLISSSQVSINRKPVPGREALFRGANWNKELVIPVLAGVDLQTSREPRVILSMKFQANFLMGDNMDGYYIPGSGNDMYGVFNIGLKYMFGPLVQY